MDFQQLMQTELRKLYATEQTLLEGLHFMADKAHAAPLRKAFETHAKESEGQARRLQEIASLVGFEIGGEESLVARALVQEAQEAFGKADPSPAVDAGLIGAAQKAEHVEIACYGTAVTMARQAGMDEAAELLGQSLAEEKKTDDLLTEIAESRVNQKAVAEAGSKVSVL